MRPPSPPLVPATRFAPSPTGKLHIGHAWSALRARDYARDHGGLFFLRIEDIDGTRSRPEHVQAILDDLRWLGIDWDGDIWLQSHHLHRYDQILEQLRDFGLLYPCFCTRADIASSMTAPHGPVGAIYPGTCRHLTMEERSEKMARGVPHAWRLDMVQAVARVGVLHWQSGSFPLNGHVETIAANPLAHGDIVLARKDAPASYHLSCSVDDADMGVTHVLRGNDLRSVTDIHCLLQALLSLPSPIYSHHPLLVDEEGHRLAKRNGSIAIADLRHQGMSPHVLIEALRSNRFPVGIHIGKA